MISARANAVETLGNPGESGPEVLKLIAEAWNDDSALVRVRAAKAVGMMGEKILNRIPQLVAGLDGLIREGLTNSEGGSGQSAIDLAGVFSAFGLPALEGIQWASWAHKDQYVRRRAGRYLIEYALDRLPAASVN